MTFGFLQCRGVLAAVLLLTLPNTGYAQGPVGSAAATLGDARFTAVTPECIRLEYAPGQRFVDAPSLFGFIRDTGYTGAVIAQDAGSLTMDTGRLQLVYRPDGQPFRRENLQILVRDTAGQVIATWHPGDRNRQNLGGTLPTLDLVTGPVALGPGLLARDGWAVVDDSGAPLLTAGWVASRGDKTSTDQYFFGYGRDYPAALRALTAVSGKVPLPRKYLLGSWYSRYWPYTSDDYRTIAAEYHEHDFPLDNMVLDMYWHKPGWTGYSWDASLMPDGPKLLTDLHAQGLYVTLNDHPADGVGPQEDSYATFMADMGTTPAAGKVLPFDAGDQTYLETFYRDTHGPLDADGVDFWWLDWQQAKYTKSVPDLLNLSWLNYYYYQQSRQGGRRGQSFSRWGGWGDHRHPIHFSGDANATFATLQFEVPFTSTSSNVGLFYWSHDIGGHYGPRDEEAFARWVQFGSTLAALRVHSTQDANLDRRPWTYAPLYAGSMQVAYHLRATLIPYIYTSMREGYDLALPLIRPLYLGQPADDVAYEQPQEYLLGDRLLVAPIVEAGSGPSKVALQTVWFPQGTWYNWFTGERFGGGSTALVAADIGEFPLFAPGGVLLPLQPYTERMTQAALTTLVVRAYPGADGETSQSSLYEDDGLTDGYTADAYARTPLTYARAGDEVTVTVGPTVGSFDGQLAGRGYTIELPATAPPESATVNGVAAAFSYDPASFTTRVVAPTLGIRTLLLVRVKVAEAQPAVVRQQALRQRLARALPAGADPTVPLATLVANDATAGLPVGSLLALGGAGMLTRPDGSYMYPGTSKLLDVALGTPDLGILTAAVRVDDVACGEVQPVFSGTCTADLGTCRYSLPPGPQLASGVLGCPTVRTAFLTAQVGGTTVTTQRPLGAVVSYANQWSIVGPFAFASSSGIASYHYGPETQPVDLAATFTDADGTKAAWQPAVTGVDGVTDLLKRYPFENRLAYAVSFLESPADQMATFYANSDDGIELFLDGAKVLSSNVLRGMDTPPDVVTQAVSAGHHVLLAKISQAAGAWAFKLRVESQLPLRQSLAP